MHEWKQRLKKQYEREKRTVRFGKYRRQLASMDDIFVDITLLQENDDSNAPDMDHPFSYGKRVSEKIAGKQLQTYEDLVQIEVETQQMKQDSGETKEEKQDQFASHILLRGAAGSGKTTLVSRIAYEWAREKTKDIYPDTLSSQTWSKFELVLVLELKKIKPHTSLEKAIQQQLLPGESEFMIGNVINKLGNGCLVLLDGFDEMMREAFDGVLDNPLLSFSFVIVTTRPHMVDQFCLNEECSDYVHVLLSGFSRKNSKQYVQRYFALTGNKDLGESLTDKIDELPVLQTLSTFPILLVMICILWESSNRKEVSFKTITGLYQEAIRYLNKPFQRDGGDKITDEEIEKVLIEIGKPALEALFANVVQISSNSFADHKEALEKAHKIGLTVEEEAGALGESYISFIHKTFQEFCAAKYLTQLFESNTNTFHKHVQDIKSYRYNVYRLGECLKFCCGLSSAVADHVIPHVVDFYGRGYWESDLKDPLLLLYEIENVNPAKNTDKLNKFLNSKVDKRLYLNDAELVSALDYFVNRDLDGMHSWLKKVDKISVMNCRVSSTFLSKMTSHMESLVHASVENVSFVNAHAERSSHDVPVHKLSIENSSIDINTLVQELECLRGLKTLSISGIKTKEELVLSTFSMPRSLSVTELEISKGYVYHFYAPKDMKDISANEVLELLQCMPSLLVLRIDATLTGDIKEPTKLTLKQLKQITVRGTMSVSAFFWLIVCMPLVTKIELEDLTLTGEVQCRPNPTQWKSSIQNIPFRKYGKNHGLTISANALIHMLQYMPLLQEVEFLVYVFDDVDDDITPAYCKEVAHLHITGSLKVKTLVKLMECMPSMTSMTLNQLQLAGEMNNAVLPSCKLLTTFQISSPDRYPSSSGISSVSASALIALLACMPFVEALNLHMKLLPDDSIATLLPRCEHLKVFSLKLAAALDSQGRSMSIQALMKFLMCMPSVTRVTLTGVDIGSDKDEVAACLISPQCYLLKNFQISGGSMHSDSMMKLLSCMPSVESMNLDVKIVDEMDTDALPHCGSLSKFELASSVSITSLLKILSCMPSVSKVTLKHIGYGGEDDKTITPKCEALTRFQGIGSIKEDILIRLLGCMPHVEDVKLQGGLETIQTEATEDNAVGDTSTLPRCKALKTFHLAGSFKDNSLLRVLQCMPHVVEIKLHLPSESELRSHKCSEGNGDEDQAISQKCTSCKIFQVQGLINGDRLITLLDCMPNVEEVKLEEIQLTKTKNINDITMTKCDKVRTFFIDGKLSAKALTKLLSCMSSAEIVRLENAQVDGSKTDGEVELQCKELQIKNSSLSAKMLVHLLNCSQQSLKRLEIGEVQLRDRRSRLSSSPLRTLRGTFCSNMSEELTRCLLAVTQAIQFAHVTRQLTMSGYSETEFQMDFWFEAREGIGWFKLLESMSSARSIQVENVGKTQGQKMIEVLSGMSSTEIEISGFKQRKPAGCAFEKQVPCLQLRQFRLLQSTLTVNCMVHILKGMPNLNTVQLLDVTLTGDMSEEVLSVCKPDVNFKYKGSASAQTMIKLLESIADVKTGMLDIDLHDEGSKGEVKTDTLNRFLNGKPISSGCGNWQVTVRVPKLVGGIDGRAMLPWVSLRTIQIICKKNNPIKCETLTRLLGNMPSVVKVDLENVTLEENLVNATFFQTPTCSLIKDFTFSGSKSRHNPTNVNRNSLKILLKCMPFVKTLTLELINVTGKIRHDQLDNLIDSAVEELHIRSSTLSKEVNNLTCSRKLVVSLRVLTLKDCHLDETHFRTMRSFQKLEEIDVSCNTGVLSLISEHWQYISNLTVLRMENTSLSSECVAKIPLAKLSNLVLLDLSRNKIGLEGVKILSTAFSNNFCPQLQHLNLASSAIDSDGATIFAQCFTSLSQMKELNMAGNHSIGVSGIKCFFSNIQHLPNLELLGLDMDIEVTEIECSPLFQAFVDKLILKPSSSWSSSYRLQPLKKDEIRLVCEIFREMETRESNVL